MTRHSFSLTATTIFSIKNLLLGFEQCSFYFAFSWSLFRYTGNSIWASMSLLATLGSAKCRSLDDNSLFLSGFSLQGQVFFCSMHATDSELQLEAPATFQSLSCQTLDFLPLQSSCHTSDLPTTSSIATSSLLKSRLASPFF